MLSFAIGNSNSRRHRERIVGSSASSLVVSNSIITCGGGSSRVFNSALAASGLIRSADGPCGGVRLDGNCEVKPEMRCVWVEAWRGSQQMRDVEAIQQVQIPVNHLLKGSSSWLRVVREEYAAHDNEVAQ